MSVTRVSEINLNGEEFKKAGHQLIDKIAEFLTTIESRPVTTSKTQAELVEVLGRRNLPELGSPAEEILSKATQLLFEHSLLNGHAKFAGYITSSPAPLGALADLLAAIVNPNVGANILSPIATEIEKQTIQWLAEFIGLPETSGGILVSGGNMANFTAFLAARTVKAPKSIKQEGISNSMKLTVYCPKSTHTWIDKAAVLFGLGANSVRWIAVDATNKMDNRILEQTIHEDLENGCQPIMVIGTAGDVSTGAVDDLEGIAAICKKFNLWFHVDGAYGAPAAVLPDFNYIFKGIEEADSVAIDPHKWLYSPLEAGCTLIKNPDHLLETYSSHPVYYNFDSDQPQNHNYYEYGLQNSRGFRALKIWMTLQQVGKLGYARLINEDIKLSRLLFKLAHNHPELDAVTQHLSITTLQYVPRNYISDSDAKIDYINKLNEILLNRLQAGGKVFLSNAVVYERYCLRSCIVNFRTSEVDIAEIVEIIVQEGRVVHSELFSRTDW